MAAGEIDLQKVPQEDSLLYIVFYGFFRDRRGYALFTEVSQANSPCGGNSALFLLSTFVKSDAYWVPCFKPDTSKSRYDYIRRTRK